MLCHCAVDNRGGRPGLGRLRRALSPEDGSIHFGEPPYSGRQGCHSEGPSRWQVHPANRPHHGPFARPLGVGKGDF